MEGKKQDLARVHEANLKVLKEIDRICRKHHIQYMLDSGTLLGAVRHKGFIPWDDDADVAFTRPNFERFMDGRRLSCRRGCLSFARRISGQAARSMILPRVSSTSTAGFTGTVRRCAFMRES